MIIAIDFETIGNPAAVALLPEPECTDSRLKDLAKIEEHLAKKRAEQTDKAALDPLTARIASYAMVSEQAGERVEFCEVIDAAADDDAERALVTEVLEIMSQPETRLITWNGVSFDLPMVYRRAMILGISPASFVDPENGRELPPLTAWTKRYSTAKHFDMMQIWTGWSGYLKLDTVAAVVLGARKVEFDVTLIKDLILTAEGRAQLVEYNLQDARLTYDLWARGMGVLYS